MVTAHVTYPCMVLLKVNQTYRPFEGEGSQTPYARSYSQRRLGVPVRHGVYFHAPPAEGTRVNG